MTSDPLEILDGIDRERGESFIGMIQANQVQRLRDEIVALREKHVEVVEFDLVRHARDAALEEAARLCERVPGDPKHGDFFASAIRTLKDKRHD